MMHKKALVSITLLLSLLVLGLFSTLAQDDHAEDCDIDALLHHQQEHAAALDTLAEDLDNDLSTALENLYVTGIAYQSLATQCGFSRTSQARAAHEDAHDTEAEHDHEEDEHIDEAVLEVARSIGDPENGEALFNTMQPETGFACATCHYTDTTERLVGPGLMGVADPEHDHAAHAGDADEADQHEDGDEHEADEHEHEEEAGEHDEGEDEHDASEAVDVDALRERAAYIRTSILDPSAFLVPEFPDNVMPQVYGDLFTEEQINDLVAYLITLQ